MRCPYCPRTCKTPQGFAQHVRYHKEKKHPLKRPFDQVRVAGGKLLKCQYCPKVCKTPQGFSQHVRFHKFPMKRQLAQTKPADPKPKKRRSSVSLKARVSEDIQVQKELNEIGMQSRFTLSQKIAILDKYQELDCNKNATVRWVRKEFKRPKYSKNSLRKAIQREDKIRKQGHSGAARMKQDMSIKRYGEFPLMEKSLADWIRLARSYGIPVETYMMNIEGERILKGLAPKQFKDGKCSFKFSTGWRKRFFSRHNFSLRKTYARNASIRKFESVEKVLSDFHLRTRILQESKSSDEKFGYCRPEGVFTHEEIPLQLASKSAFSVDETGADIVWDSVNKDSDIKRFCTLDLIVPMKALSDKSNLPKPHIIFSCETGFKRGCDWSEEERKKWSPDVVVSFRENGWSDVPTCVFALENLKKQVANSVTNSNPVLFEDDLPSYKSKLVEEFWRSSLPSWKRVVFPQNISWCLQPIERNVRMAYQLDVFTAIRDRMMEKFQAEDNTPLTESEKRILITHCVAKTHARLAEGGAFERAFTTNGIWLPIDGSMDEQVKFKGLEKYDYLGVCSKRNVSKKKHEILKENEQKKKKEAEEKKARDVEKRALAETQDPCETNPQDLEHATRQGGAWLQTHGNKVFMTLCPALETIHKHVGTNFILAGSFVPAAISSFMQQSNPEFPSLEYNNIDVFVGDFGPGKLSRLSHVPKKVPELDKKLNIIHCRNLNQHHLLETADINAIAMNLQVSFNPLRVAWAISPDFWGFVFSKRLRTLNSSTPAQTLIRVAYKSFKMDLEYDSNLKPDGEFYASHLKKLEEMKGWDGNPFRGYVIKTNPASKGTYMFESSVKMSFVCLCGRKAAKNCKYSSCASCCKSMKRKPPCKLKSHK